ncbi:MAG TPA: histidine phosphatase family protein [Clostridia bacterium]|nr:histidine phosphatase family protein [Clostridia bacterium]
MTTIYLMRHGETQWNKEGIFRGRADIPLNENGRIQAKAAGRRLKRAAITACFTSPLVRAKETAEIVCKEIGLAEPALFGDLIDVDFGEWEGLSKDQVAQMYPELYKRWQTDPVSVTFPCGESLTEVFSRAVAALLCIARDHPEERILVVTHRVLTKLMLTEALGAGPGAFWRIMQDTACINIIDVHTSNRNASERYVVRLVNDTCHLTPETPDANGLSLATPAVREAPEGSYPRTGDF